MRITPLHAWDVTPAEAVALQRDLAGRVDVSRPLAAFDLVAGADISYNLRSPTLYAAVVVVRAADGAVVETASAVEDVAFPYVPGLLSFREAPPLLRAFERLQTTPDVVMFDGQGVAHPRRLGIASHLGLWLGVPCFGCAKSLLVGRLADLPPEAGAQAPLVDRKEVVGAAVRTRDKVNPVYVSAGHLIDLPSAVRVTLATAGGYRIPEPTRRAHILVNELRTAGGGGRG